MASINDLRDNLENLEIIVLVKRNDFYSWYVSEKYYWIMNHEKYVHISDENNFDYSERFGIGKLDENTVGDFLENMTSYQVNESILQELIVNSMPLSSRNECGHLFPTLYLNFDDNLMFSLYNEFFSFENFVPDNWNGKYDDFYDLIPDKNKYWIIDGTDVLQPIIS